MRRTIASMADNPYEAPQEPIDPDPREYPRWVHYSVATLAIVPLATSAMLFLEACDRYAHPYGVGTPASDFFIYSAVFGVAGLILTLLVARLRRR